MSEYNGYTNYETWNVSLWIDNDHGTYSYTREQSEAFRDDAYGYADWLKEFVTEDNTESFGTAAVAEQSNLASDLLSAALSEVNWYEIAESYLSELEPLTDDYAGDTEESE